MLFDTLLEEGIMPVKEEQENEGKEREKEDGNEREKEDGEEREDKEGEEKKEREEEGESKGGEEGVKQDDAGKAEPEEIKKKVISSLRVTNVAIALLPLHTHSTLHTAGLHYGGDTGCAGTRAWPLET